jgi:hypothetical protein
MFDAEYGRQQTISNSGLWNPARDFKTRYSRHGNFVGDYGNSSKTSEPAKGGVPKLARGSDQDVQRASPRVFGFPASIDRKLEGTFSLKS